jgi:membrane associated rhomboid family serine protease
MVRFCGISYLCISSTLLVRAVSGKNLQVPAAPGVRYERSLLGALPCESSIQLRLRPVLNLRGGGKRQPERAKKKLMSRQIEQTTFILTNILVYAILYKGMTRFGAVFFINTSCFFVWALWAIVLFEKAILHVSNEISSDPAAFVKVALNFIATALSSDDGHIESSNYINDLHPFLLEKDIETVHIHRGSSFNFPSSSLLLNCDDGLVPDEFARARELDISSIVSQRSEIVALEFVDEMTFMKRKQSFKDELPGNDTSDSFLSLFSTTEVEKVSVARGAAVKYPPNMILIDCDNGFDSMMLNEIKSYNQFKKRSENVTMSFVQERVFCKKYIKHLKASRNKFTKYFETYLNSYTHFMKSTFLAPLKWSKLRSRPLALFGSVFSHMDLEHISGNMAMLSLCSEAESWLGTSKFAHLYLLSGVLGKCAACLWAESSLGMVQEGGRGSESLGASGAVNGVVAWWCIQNCKMGKKISFHNDKRIDPLLFWVLFVAIDASGLLRLGFAKSVFESVLGKLVGLSDTDTEPKMKKKEQKDNIGHGAHLGGALGGALFHVLFP